MSVRPNSRMHRLMWTKCRHGPAMEQAGKTDDQSDDSHAGRGPFAPGAPLIFFIWSGQELTRLPLVSPIAVLHGAIMNNQNIERPSPAVTQDRQGATTDIAATASVAISKASDIAQEVADRATHTASEAVSTVGDQVKEVLGRQVVSGVDVIGKLAASTRRTADDLEESAPLVAGMVRTVSERVDGYATNLRGQSVDQLMRTASDLTRRRPALIFGLAALAGFVACRTLKSAPAKRFSREPFVRQGANEFHGG